MISKLLKNLPPANSYRRYVEPFAGSAALFLSKSWPSPMLADANAELINFYNALKHRRLTLMSRYRDVRRISERDVETYLGIQRPLSSGRVAELKQYVNTVDATFPTNVIIAVSSEYAEYDPKTSTMTIQKEEHVAKIIDGQHRIAGLENFQGAEFQITVIIFVDMDMEDQAMVFATINLKQTKVGKSLAYDLYDFAKARSPQKTCHNIAKLLNYQEGSPFRRKIKILGTATGGPSETLTQATFVDKLMQYISVDPMSDRDLLKRGKKLNPIDESKFPRLIFRNWFIDEADAKIAKVVWNYFTAVQTRWQTAWTESKQGNILNRTTGFGTLMRFLPIAFRHVGKDESIQGSQAFVAIFKKITLTEADFSPDKYKPGSSGGAALF